MDAWIGVLVALAVGVPVLAVGVVADVRERRRRKAQLASAPLRNDASVDALLPRYVTQEEIDAMPPPGTGTAPVDCGGQLLQFGHLCEDFATDGRVARLEHASVVLVDDDVTSMRELLVPLAGAAPASPLVVAAASFHADVVGALVANRRAMRLPVVAVVANPAELLQLQDVVGGHILSGADLKAGWLPPTAIGHAGLWCSTMEATRVTGNLRNEG